MTYENCTVSNSKYTVSKRRPVSGLQAYYLGKAVCVRYIGDNTLLFLLFEHVIYLFIYSCIIFYYWGYYNIIKYCNSYTIILTNVMKL